jgi:hypothetical protein
LISRLQRQLSFTQRKENAAKFVVIVCVERIQSSGPFIGFPEDQQLGKTHLPFLAGIEISELGLENDFGRIVS